MIPNDTHEPAPRFKVSRWLIGAVMTWSLIFGAIGAIGVLFLADKSLFDTGVDPAIPNEEIQEQVQQQVFAVDQRLKTLEAKQDNSYLPNTDDIMALKNKLTSSIEETMQLKQQVTALQNGTQQDNRLARTVMGLTQLKAAYESDTSLQPGIMTLQQLTDNETVQKTLEQLSALTAQDFPSKKVILENVHALNAPAANNEPTDKSDLDLKSRAKLALGRLVSIKPSKDAEQERKATQIEQAVNYNNFSLAAALAKELPETPSSVALTNSIQTRLKAQKLMQQLIFQVSKTATQNNKAVY
jgi:hypothetical protein